MLTKTILIAEDNPDDALIFKLAYNRARLPHRLYFADDGQQIIDWLGGTGNYTNRESFPLPDLVILDLKMPRKSGFETLEWIRRNPAYQQVPVIILTSSDDPRDLRRASAAQATSYFVKSPRLHDVMEYLRTC